MERAKPSRQKKHYDLKKEEINQKRREKRKRELDDLQLLIECNEDNNNEELTKYYYDMRNGLFKEQEETNKGEALPNMNYQEKLNTLPNNKYKLIFLLMINY